MQLVPAACMPWVGSRQKQANQPWVVLARRMWVALSSPKAGGAWGLNMQQDRGKLGHGPSNWQRLPIVKESVEKLRLVMHVGYNYI